MLRSSSFDQNIVSTLPTTGSAPAGPSVGPAVKLDLSAEAQAILAGGGPNAPDPSEESGAGTGWEAGYDPAAHTTANDQMPELDFSWAYDG